VWDGTLNGFSRSGFIGGGLVNISFIGLLFAALSAMLPAVALSAVILAVLRSFDRSFSVSPHLSSPRSS